LNSEFVLNNIKTMMETYLTAMLRTVETEASAVTQTTDPQEYIIGERDLDILTMFPAVLIYGKNSSDNDDEFGDSIVRILRKESYWNKNLHTPIVRMCTFTDLFKSTIGYAQGVMVNGEIRYIIS